MNGYLNYRTEEEATKMSAGTLVGQFSSLTVLAVLAGKLQRTETPGEKVEQRLKFVPVKPQEGVKLVLRGTVIGSEEAFPAETPSEAQKRFAYLRNSVGLSHNLRNNAVYDRRWDWVLIGPPDGRTRIKPKRVEKRQITFSWESRGSDLEVVFRPRFYQKHKDLKYYQPWTHKIWKGSVTGFCSWWAYKAGFNQKETATVRTIPSATKTVEWKMMFAKS